MCGHTLILVYLTLMVKMEKKYTHNLFIFSSNIQNEILIFQFH
jgi:hypothetical protein